MSTPVRQQRRLSGIEAALQASEPRLAAMFATFSRLHRGDGPVEAEPLSRSWPRFRNLPKFIPVLITIMLIAGLIIAVSGQRSASCTTAQGGGHAVATGNARAIALPACAPREAGGR